MFVPSNNLVKLGIGGAHYTRIRLSEMLFSPVAVNFNNPAIPMFGGSVGNRSGQAVKLNSIGIAGNTGAYKADYSAISGDTISIIRKFTSDGVEYQVADYLGNQVGIEAPNANHPSYAGLSVDWNNDGTGGDALPGTTADVPLLKGIPRYIVKSDGVIYDCLIIRDQNGSSTAQSENTQAPVTPGGGFQHWEFAAAGGGFYTAASNSYNASAALASLGGTLQGVHYTRPVGRISFRPKSGSGAQVIQDHLGRAQTSLDALSRVLRTLNDEAKGPFANIVLR